MKISSQDATTLVATDKAYSNLIVGVILALAGLGLLGSWPANHQTIVAVIGAVLLAVGVLMVVTRKQRTLSIDKTAGQVTFSVKSLVKSSQHPFAVADVTKVEFVTQLRTTTTPGQPNQPGLSFGAGGNTQTTEQTEVHLMLKDGTIIDLADGSRSMSGMGLFGKVPNQGVAQQIADFLGVPFEQAGSASLGQVVTQIRDAVSGQTAAPSVVPAAPAPTPVAPTPPPAATPPTASETTPPPPGTNP